MARAPHHIPVTIAAAILSLLILAVSVRLAVAQSCLKASEPNARKLAERYAPILSFAPGERYFPTIPFFTALDHFNDAIDAVEPMITFDH